jgi:Glycosyl transferase family 2
MIALSILTPSVPSRFAQTAALCEKIGDQIESLPGALAMLLPSSSPVVEHLVFTDNKQRRVGAKRQDLLNLARGEYIAFVDDDDTISDHYVAKLLEAITRKPDVVTFLQHCTVNGVEGLVKFDLLHRHDHPFAASPHVTERRPWHLCAWRRELALQGLFPEIDYGEDAAWVDQVVPLARTQVHMPEILHYYRHSAATTEAPPPGV